MAGGSQFASELSGAGPGVAPDGLPPCGEGTPRGRSPAPRELAGDGLSGGAVEVWRGLYCAERNGGQRGRTRGGLEHLCEHHVKNGDLQPQLRHGMEPAAHGRRYTKRRATHHLRVEYGQRVQEAEEARPLAAAAGLHGLHLGVARFHDPVVAVHPNVYVRHAGGKPDVFLLGRRVGFGVLLAPPALVDHQGIRDGSACPAEIIP